MQRDASNSAYVFAPTSPATTTYADNNLNQYTSVGAVTQSYDTRGNLTTGSLGYDVFNRLVSGPSSAALLYDAQGRLYETNVGGSSVTRFLYDGAQIIGEYDGSSTPALQRRFIPGPALDEHAAWYEGSGTSDRRWLAADERGSIIALLNASGAATTINTYDEYGIRGSSNAGRFQFTGAPWLTEVALYHMRARAYSPTLGRFLQTDPILHAGGMNLYAYVGNDPVNFVDPLGLEKDIYVTATRLAGGGVSPGLFGGTGGFEGRMRTAPDEEDIVVTAETCGDDAECWRRRFGDQSIDDATFDFAGFFMPGLRGLGFLDDIGRGICRLGCFEEGTLVATPDGLRAIESLEVGDQVLAWNPETGETTIETVTALIRPEPRTLWRLQVRDADNEIETFFVTDDHPWYVEGSAWVETQHLRAGLRIETADDRGLIILDIARTDRVERTYNLTVSGPHTFLVGEDGAVVHNCRTLARIYGDLANKLRHVFVPRHNLGGMVGRYGSQEAAFAAIHRSAQSLAGRQGVVTATIDVAGTQVVVRGTSVNGVFRVGSAWIPGP